MVLKSEKLKSPKDKEKAFSNFFMIDWKKVLKNEGTKKANSYLLHILNDLE